MARHLIDRRAAPLPAGRLLHYLKIERGPRRSWTRAALAMRRRHDPPGRTLSQFAAIERGRRV